MVIFLGERHFEEWPAGQFRAIRQALEEGATTDNFDAFFDHLRIAICDLTFFSSDDNDCESYSLPDVSSMASEEKRQMLERASATQDFINDFSKKSDDDIKSIYQRTKLEDIERDEIYSDPNATSFDASIFRNRPLLPEDAVALSFNLNPKVITPGRIEELRRSCLEAVGQESPLASKYLDRLSRLKRAIEGKLVSLPIRLNNIVDWAREEGMEFTLEDVSDLKPRKEEEKLHGHTRALLHKLLLAMAAKHDPTIPSYVPQTPAEMKGDAAARKRSEVAGKIEDELVKLGLSAGEQSIRGHLESAAKWARDKGIKTIPPKK